MSDRATYLARTLLSRLQSLETVLTEETGGTTGSAATTRRRELVAKILAIEAGVTDESSIRAVESALPTISPKQRPTDRELASLADFLRHRLGAALQLS